MMNDRVRGGKSVDIKLDVVGQEHKVIILEGRASDPINPSSQRIAGTIDAPLEFWRKRLSCLPSGKSVCSNGVNYSADTAYVKFGHSTKQITLIIDASRSGHIVVNGSFIVNPLLANLKINQREAYESHGELLRAIRFSSEIFKTLKDHKEFLARLRNFTVKVTKTHQEQSDQKGNSNKSREVSLDEGFEPLDFTIHVPVFNGEEALDIGVSVEIEERNGDLEYYLVSLELPRLMLAYQNKRFAEIKPGFAGIPIINE